MPASYVHQCVAKDAADQLTLFKDDQLHAALLAGSEGPDPFFFSLFAPPSAPSAPKLGSLMHTKKTGDFLTTLAKACAHDAVTQAFCCGFFTHYGTDTTFHPFVYAHSASEDGSYSGTIHCTLEHALELFLYRRRAHGTRVPVQMAGYIRLTKENKDKIAHALSSALDEVFPEHRLGHARVRRSFEDAAGLCTLLRSKTGHRYKAFGAIAALIKMDKALHAHMIPPHLPQEDIANQANAPWRSPWQPDLTRTEGFSDLFDAAIQRAKELIPAALAFMDGAMNAEELRAVTGDNSFDSGLPWQETRPAKELFASQQQTQA